MNLSISLSPDILFYIGSFPVTNTFFWSIIITIFLILIFVLVGQRLKDKPSKLQNFIEILIEEAYSFVVSVIGPGKKARRIFPLVATMFIFVLVSNLIVYIPGQNAVSIDLGAGPVAIFRAVMSDYGLVLIMTLIAVITTQIVAIAVSGPFKYIGKFLNFRSPMGFFLGLMDLVGEIAKIVSLSFRLFGNIFAGEVLGMVMLFLAPFFVPLPFMFLGLLTAVVQAFVFAVLTLVFVSMASESEA
ncbi:MAG: F0F1 ATP synthase subunit A [Patescibacteria group bacterium]|nr:F0F1 ATP synthase subunit A [Patescibacteria group bacterium]